ncbi:vWA domain-containing protein [Candidatus Entotheonella palauensis]|uniref:VWFA domain-containing protein n=1 Tax=Candidatus Entotheonella gemina TaxID=1429439 RepID=W4M0V2_9BACT|nr:VWA domain-containing protein [Candidatus Entotheonella palauensis]ETX03969.1 MAG: hypothetical protein ETSY2_31500 [Candidatus Entotheonella gemina]
MRFAHPDVLWFLLLCPLLGLLIALGRRRYAALLQHLGEPRLFQHTRSHVPWLHRPWVQVGLLLLPVLSLIMALADPRMYTGTPYIKAGALDTVMALDVSTSMAAEDVNGRSRLAVARDIVRSLLPELRGNRVGFITFAGTSFRQAELTEDLDALDFIVKRWIKEGSAGVAGSNLAQAIEAGLDLFSDDPERTRLMLLFSDGGDVSETLQPALARAASQGVVIVTLGLGSMQPSRIPQYDAQGKFTNYVEVGGTVATTRLNAKPLQRIASATSGTYEHVRQRRTWRHLLTRHAAASDLLTHDEKPIFQTFLLVGLLACATQVLATRL